MDTIGNFSFFTLRPHWAPRIKRKQDVGKGDVRQLDEGTCIQFCNFGEFSYGSDSERAPHVELHPSIPPLFGFLIGQASETALGRRHIRTL